MRSYRLRQIASGQTAYDRMKKALQRSIVFISLAGLYACSTTKTVPDDDQLFTGLTKIEYKGYDEKQQKEHFISTQEEIEAALATAPNGALFGSPYYRTPFPYRLWIYNYSYGSHGKFKQWLNKSFGKAPVLMSQINPSLRASVGRSVLRNNGYLHGDVSFTEVPQKSKKKMKIGYTVNLDSLFLVDSMAYVGFPADMQQLIDSTLDDAYIKKGVPFTVANLDAERQRISRLMRNNGYYYYQPSFASFLADTFDIPNRAKLRLQMADSLPQQALQKWYIGSLRMTLQRTAREQLTDSAGRHFLKLYYSGKKPPIRPSVILRDLKLRPRQLYSYDKYIASMQNINSVGLFSSTDFKFVPREGTDSLDLFLTCTFDKPYDFYFETSYKNRTIGRMGPEAKIGFTRRNAFRGGEKIDINLHGSYEWQTSGNDSGNNSYSYGVDGSIEFPRIIAPFIGSEEFKRDKNGRLKRDKNGKIIRPRTFYSTPWTVAKASTDIIMRPGYYKMHIVSGEWSYRWQTSEQRLHQFSPLTVKYQYKNSYTDKFQSLLEKHPYLSVTMGDYFIPKMRYTYTYSNRSGSRYPYRWETTIEESGNFVSLYFMAKGEKWNTENKELFKTPYSQFLKLETDYTKTWTLDHQSQLVGHINAGIIWMFGNSSNYPFSEGFWVGGANSIRAFSARSIGPGDFRGIPGDRQSSYLIQNGNSKLVMNLEYRRRLFGSLYGAMFFDAGNIWSERSLTMDKTEDMSASDIAEADEWNDQFTGTKFQFKNLFNQLATGTGLGLRYDLEFLVIRVDWGFGLHVPYKTSKSGYFNIERFKDMHSLHLAIGYPF